MSETLIGAIIGASAAILGGGIGQVISYCIDKKNRKYENKKRTYEQLMDLICSVDQGNIVEDHQINQVYYLLKLYASDDVGNKFEEYINADKKDLPNKQQILFDLEKLCSKELN